MQEISALQYEADAATKQASGEQADIKRELNRLGTLLQAFQAQMAEVRKHSPIFLAQYCSQVDDGDCVW